MTIDYKEMNKKYETATIESIQMELDELNKGMTRRHGRAPKHEDDPELEKKKRWSNLQSRKSRHARKDIETRREKANQKYLGITEDEDEHGIRPVDERSYKQCFHSGYIDAPVYLRYVKMMTGLSLKQIAVLQKRTGLIPTPKVDDAEAEADFQKRWLAGDVY